MHLRYLRTFAAAATTLNFTRAAETVHLAVSSVTEQIQALEAELGVALFDRRRRRISLTPAGERFLCYARDLLALSDEARAAVIEVAAGSLGKITIGGLETLVANWLPSLVMRARGHHPALEIAITVGSSAKLANDVRGGEADVGFIFGAGPASPDLLQTRVGETRLVAVVPPGHRFAALTELDLAALSGEPFIATEIGCIYREMYESAFPAGNARRPPIVSEVGSVAAIPRLVEAGLGCALLPTTALTDQKTRCVTLKLGGCDDVVPITMLWKRRRVQPPGLRLFLQTARDR